MQAVRRRVRCGLAVLACVLAGVLPGCRGEAKDADRAAAPVDEKLAWPALDEAALAAAVATRGFELGAPVPLAILPDGAVLFRRSPPRDPSADLYQLDAAGATKVLVTAAALLASGPSGNTTPVASPAAAPGIDDVEVSNDGARILVPLAGRLFVVARATGASRELAVGAHRDPRLSPDGKRAAFVQDGDLWVVPVGEPASGKQAAPDSTAPVRVTRHPTDREYATPEPVARDFGRRHGYWWSPDGESIAFQRTNARAVDGLFLGDPRHLEQPPAPVRYPRSGKTNATVDLGIVSVRGGAPRWVTWDLARYPYLARVIWPARGALTLIVVSREQTQLAVLAVDPATGATRPLLTEKGAAWLNVADDALTWLPDGSGFLWMTETHGAWDLEHHAADGALVRQILTPDIGLRGVAGISRDGRAAIIEAAADPREQHVWRVPLAGGDPVALTAPTAGGVHHAIADHGVVVIRSANRAGGRSVVALRDGGARVELPSVAERPAAAPTTKLETVIVVDHTVHTAFTRPRAFDPKVRYPVLLRLESWPAAKGVLDAMASYLTDQWLADAGFIVVRADGRGTIDRDRDWERVIAGDVLTIPMTDQLGALKQLAAHHPELDVTRVGAFGSAYGGYLAAIGALIHPDVFAAAVAVSPITDWELLDTVYAERYMKTPAANPEGYRRTAAATYAEQMKRPLLLIAGTNDERIHFAHTLALVEALSAAGKPVEFATLAAAPDAAPDAARIKLALEFLREHVGPPIRPAVMPVARSEEEEEEEEERRRAKGSARGAGGDKDRDQDRR